MKIALLHNHVDQEHLIEVMGEMMNIGAPQIKAVYMECYDHWAALEGTHRIIAAKRLGLTPELIIVDYNDDETLSDHDCDDSGDDLKISEICDSSFDSKVVEF